MCVFSVGCCQVATDFSFLYFQEKKNLKEAIAKTYIDELKEMRDMFEAKQKELVEVNKISSELKHAMVDLNERLNASMQNCNESNEIMRR